MIFRLSRNPKPNFYDSKYSKLEIKIRNAKSLNLVSSHDLKTILAYPNTKKLPSILEKDPN
jgi:hypothetical protein